MKLIYFLVMVWAVVITASAFTLFGEPQTSTPVQEVWKPIDKCWAFNPDNRYGGSQSGIVYFIVYINQNGYHKIESVDIDTWYDFSHSPGVPQMYRQGSDYIL